MRENASKANYRRELARFEAYLWNNYGIDSVSAFRSRVTDVFEDALEDRDRLDAIHAGIKGKACKPKRLRVNRLGKLIIHDFTKR